MIAASAAVQRPRDARLLAIDRHGRIVHAARSQLATLFRPGDLLIANDAATLPASLAATHVPTGALIEVRLAGRPSLAPDRVGHFTAVVFGTGDFRTPTEHRPLPPPLQAGDTLRLGPLWATIRRLLGHPRLVSLRFHGSSAEFWRGLARHGRPIQYAHLATPLAIWDTWTAVAAVPAAFEPPSAGFILDWHLVESLRSRGVALATLTHAAGLSSTGDRALDVRLPLAEPYRIPASTRDAMAEARRRGGRIIAIGTTVVRALEDAATGDGLVRAGDGLATHTIGAGTRLRVVDALVSGTHEPGTSHYELLRAFADLSVLEDASRQLDAHGYRTHEFGDSVFIESSRGRVDAGRAGLALYTRRTSAA